MKHKRKKTKRNVRCQLCTTHRWMGNNAGRFKAKDEAAAKQAKRDMKEAA